MEFAIRLFFLVYKENIQEYWHILIILIAGCLITMIVLGHFSILAILANIGLYVVSCAVAAFSAVFGR